MIHVPATTCGREAGARGRAAALWCTFSGMPQAGRLLGSWGGAEQRVLRVGALAQSMVKEVRETEVVLQNGETVPYGVCVW